MNFTLSQAAQAAAAQLQQDAVYGMPTNRITPLRPDEMDIASKDWRRPEMYEIIKRRLMMTLPVLQRDSYVPYSNEKIDTILPYALVVKGSHCAETWFKRFDMAGSWHDALQAHSMGSADFKHHAMFANTIHSHVDHMFLINATGGLQKGTRHIVEDFLHESAEWRDVLAADRKFDAKRRATDRAKERQRIGKKDLMLRPNEPISIREIVKVCEPLFLAKWEQQLAQYEIWWKLACFYKSVENFGRNYEGSPLREMPPSPTELLEKQK